MIKVKKLRIINKKVSVEFYYILVVYVYRWCKKDGLVNIIRIYRKWIRKKNWKIFKRLELLLVIIISCGYGLVDEISILYIYLLIFFFYLWSMEEVFKIKLEKCEFESVN